MRRSHMLWRGVRPFYLAWCRICGPGVSNGGPPCGVFSEADAVKRGEVEGDVSQPAAHMNAIPQDSEIIRANLGQQRHTDWNSVWSLRDNARLLSPGLPHVDAAGRACYEAMHGPHHFTDPVFRRRGTSQVTRIDHCATSILSRWNDGSSYYHWFLDGLTRLTHLDRFPTDTKILIPSHLPAFARRSLEILGLESRAIPAPDGDLEIARYAFAGPTMISGCPNPLGVAWLRNAFLSTDPPAPEPTLDIYIERTANRRVCKNATQLSEAFSRRGWTVVDPGSLDLDAQIQLFRQARRVAGIHGAGLTNLLWMPAGSRVLEIMPSRRRNGCYAAIAHCIGIHHRAWVLPSDRLGNLAVPVNEVSHQLDALDECH